jgi:hemoglobin/transferrin/lactoferrin receptor protein
MGYRTRGARALLGGISVIALSVAGGIPCSAAQVDLDPVTVIATKPVSRPSQPSGPPAEVSTARRAPASRGVRRVAPAVAPPPAPVAAQPATDIMPASETLGPVSTVRQDQINQIIPTRPADLLNTIPGVATPIRGDDPATAINIRGLQDFGRVNTLIDGARQNFQRSGHNANGMFYLEPELISSIDVIRGPVANVFGSGAIGGIASFRTKDVEDVLKAGERWGVLGNLTGNSNLGGVGSAFAATRLSPNAEIFAGGTWRGQGDYRDGNNNYIQNTHNRVWTDTVKGTFRPAEGHQVKLGYINYDAFYNTGQPFPIGTPGPSASIYATKTRNEIATTRWTYGRLDDRIFNFDINAYWTKTETGQQKIDGTPSAVNGLIGATRNFNIKTIGVDGNNTTRFDTGLLRHALNIGGDSFRDEVDTDGFGTVFTPSGERTVSGSFAQIKTDYAGFLETITAVRYDKYSLQGGGFYSDGDRVSPKVTIGLTAIRGITPYVIYAEGYRAPAVTEAFIDGIHPSPPNFTLLPNPQLRPEVGKNEELGVNLRYNDVLRLGDQFRAKFNIYRNHVENYIDLRPLAFGQRGQSGLTCQNRLVFFCYQYQNIQDARLSGMEFETYYDAGLWFAGLAGTHGVWGRDVTNNLPLATIPPDQVTTTLGARFLDRRLTVAVRWQAVRSKNPNDIPPGAEAQTGAVTGPPYFYYPTSSFNLINIYAGYQINPDTLASLSVDNLLNQQYAPYLNVSPSPLRGVNSTPLPFFSPGLTVKGSLTVRFSDLTLRKG